MWKSILLPEVDYSPLPFQPALEIVDAPIHTPLASTRVRVIDALA